MIAASSSKTANHRTRRAAEAWLVEHLTAAVHAGQRALVGLDFPYGYPAGFAAALNLGGEPWRAVWKYLECHISDDDLNGPASAATRAGLAGAALGIRAGARGRGAERSRPGRV